MTEALVEAYAIGLEGIKGEQIVRATKWLLAHHREFMPTPAEIREAVQLSYVEPPRKELPEPPPMTEEMLAEVQKAFAELAEKLDLKRGIADGRRQTETKRSDDVGGRSPRSDLGAVLPEWIEDRTVWRTYENAPAGYREFVRPADSDDSARCGQRDHA